MMQPQRRGLAWQKAAGCAGGECVEVASTEGGVAVRDSKDPSGPVLVYTADEWDAFVHGIKLGEFDNAAQG